MVKRMPPFDCVAHGERRRLFKGDVAQLGAGDAVYVNRGLYARL